MIRKNIKEKMQFESIIIWYKNAIVDFAEILEIVPYNLNNKSVIIPRLAPIIIESCSLLDTLFFNLNEWKKEKPDIRDYKKFYNNKLKLSSVDTFFFSEDGVVIRPFEIWENIDGPASPIWWESYNKLKHNRIVNMEKSTLENTVLSLVALTQFLARNEEFFPALYRHELIVTNYNPEYVMEKYDVFWNNSHSEISLENNLFLTPFGDTVFKRMKHSICTTVIQSKKLKNFLVKWG